MLSPKKKDNAVSPKALKVAFGVFLMLLSLAFLLSGGTHLSFLGGYVLSYLFGLSGYILLPLLGILFSLGLFGKRLRKMFGLRFFFGYLLAFLGSLPLLSLLNPIAIEGGDFASSYQGVYETVASSNFSMLLLSKLGGGVLGEYLVSVLPQWVGVLIVVLLMATGVVLVFLPLIIAFFRFLKASSSIARANASKRKAEAKARKEKLQKEKEERIPMETPVEEEPLHRKRVANPLDSLSFEPASTAAIPSRTSRYSNGVPVIEEEEKQPITTEKKAEEPIYTPIPTGPKPVPTPTPSSYRGNPIRTAGIHEAFFDPDGSTKQPTPIVPKKEEPAPTPEPIPTPVPTPSVSEVLPPLEEAKPIPAPTVPVSDSVRTPAPAHESVPAFEEPRLEETPSIFASNPIEEALPKTSIPPQGAVQEKLELESKEEDEEEEALPPYEFPPMSLLAEIDDFQDREKMEEECKQRIEIIDATFSDLGVGAHVSGFVIGPSVTRFAIQPDRNVSVSTLSRFIPDIESRIGGVPTRYAERVTGLTTPAIEIANNVSRTVSLREVISALPPLKESTRMYVPFGVKITGEAVVANLCEFPHMLLAGTTGSGKSIFVHSILLSLIMRNRPEELKLVLVDPKRVEMTKYKDIPHLLCPIIKEPVEAKNALKKLVDEMNRRYRLFDHASVQNIAEYNSDYAPDFHKKKLPYIVVVVDEFADLVNSCKQVSEYVLLLGGKARAAGIHMIIATQRPDTKVISGTIKANLPCAVALSVRSSVDSTVILGCGGAEDLAGHGDMLIDCAQIGKKELVRAQGAFVSSRELRAVPEFVRGQQQVVYHPAFLDLEDHDEDETPGEIENGSGEVPALPGAVPSNNDGEAKYQYIKSVIMTREYTSISQIQRDFSVGFPRAGKIFNRLKEEGIVDGVPVSSSKGCRVLIHQAPSTSSPGSIDSSTVEPIWKSDPEEDIS